MFLLDERTGDMLSYLKLGFPGVKRQIPDPEVVGLNPVLGGV